MLSTMVGVMVFLLFLLLAVQVLFDLYATSAVTAAAHDGARIASGADAAIDPAAREAAEEHVRAVLGRYGRDRVEVRWEDGGTGRDVALTVTATNPSFVPAALRRPLGLDRVERTVRVRAEHQR